MPRARAPPGMGKGGHLPPPGKVQMGICNPSPEFLTVFVVGLSRISGVVPTYLRMSLTRAVERLPLFAVQPSGGTEVVYILTTRRVPGTR